MALTLEEIAALSSQVFVHCLYRPIRAVLGELDSLQPTDRGKQSDWDFSSRIESWEDIVKQLRIAYEGHGELTALDAIILDSRQLSASLAESRGEKNRQILMKGLSKSITSNEFSMRKGRRKTLPSGAVKYLRSWFDVNGPRPILPPEAKQKLKEATGLTINQILHWIKNERARRRRIKAKAKLGK